MTICFKLRTNISVLFFHLVSNFKGGTYQSVTAPVTESIKRVHNSKIFNCQNLKFAVISQILGKVKLCLIQPFIGKWMGYLEPSQFQGVIGTGPTYRYSVLADTEKLVLESKMKTRFENLDPYIPTLTPNSIMKMSKIFPY